MLCTVQDSLRLRFAFRLVRFATLGTGFPRVQRGFPFICKGVPPIRPAFALLAITIDCNSV